METFILPRRDNRNICAARVDEDVEFIKYTDTIRVIARCESLGGRERGKSNTNKETRKSEGRRDRRAERAALFARYVAIHSSLSGVPL